MVCGGMLAFNALIAIRRTGIAPSQRGRFTRIGGKADVARRSFEIDGGGHGGIDARACSSDQLRGVPLLSLMP
jgi:hypothetical protein